MKFSIKPLKLQRNFKLAKFQENFKNNINFNETLVTANKFREISPD